MDMQDLIIKEITEVITVYKTRGTKIEMKNRSSYALSFSTGGKITYEHNGVFYVSDVDSVIFHPKNSDYTLNCIVPGTFHLINFELADQDVPYFMELKTTDAKFILQMVNEIKNNFFKQTKKAKNLSLLYDVIDMLSPTKQDDYNLLSPAISAINNEFFNPEINVSALANLCFISECYFRRKFYDTFGVSPKRYLTEKRIKYSMQLLKEGNLSITQIAEKCGFNNVYHFSKTFKEQVNITPSEYATRNKITAL